MDSLICLKGSVGLERKRTQSESLKLKHFSRAHRNTSHLTMSVEAQRQLLEELNVLEWAIAKRFRRNPELRKEAAVEDSDEVLELRPKRPRKETILQQHELQFFAEQHEAALERLKRLLQDDSVARDISNMKDPEVRFGAFLDKLDRINSTYPKHQAENAIPLQENYALYSSGGSQEDLLVQRNRKVKRNYFLSAATEHIGPRLTKAFSEVEHYGSQIDLSAFYELNKVFVPTQSYLEYLRLLQNFQVTSTSHDYNVYLESLLKYLEQFYHNAYPLKPLQYPEANENDSQPKGLFCEACNKHFAKDTVYQGHLSGKKHQKNVQNAAAKNGDTSAHAPPTLTVTQKLIFLLGALKSQLQNTITDIERRSQLSEREKLLEDASDEEALSDFTDVDSDASNQSESENDDDADDAYLKDLPLGTDGIPIPLWLFKLQGLHKSYSCEICGNSSYKGWQQFVKHFSQAKHAHGLACLGIPELEVTSFKNISTINEAQNLWERLKKLNLAANVAEEHAVEVEDEDGNVMSKKDYLELQRQGLI